MKGNWKYMKLGEVIALEYGKPLEKGKRADDGMYPAYGANGEKCRTNEYLVDKPSIIVGRKGSAGEITLVKDKFWPLDVTYFVTFDETKYDLQFLYYLLLSLNLPKLATGVKPGINRNKVYSIVVNIPELQEQKRIVAMLDEAFEDIDKARELTEQNLKNARELFDSYLSQTFESRTKEWHKQKFGEVCHFVRGPFGGALKKSIFKPEGFAVYEQQHAIYDQFQDIRYFVDGEKFEQMSRFELLPGDLIISCSGTMGKIAIAPPNIKRGIINQALLKLTPKLGITAQFLKIWMESPNFQREIESRAQGAAIKNMASVKVLKDIFIPIPSAVVQHEIVDLHDRLKTLTSSLESNYMTKLSELSKLKESILSRQFQGV